MQRWKGGCLGEGYWWGAFHAKKSKCSHQGHRWKVETTNPSHLNTLIFIRFRHYCERVKGEIANKITYREQIKLLFHFCQFHFWGGYRGGYSASSIVYETTYSNGQIIHRAKSSTSLYWLTNGGLCMTTRRVEKTTRRVGKNSSGLFLTCSTCLKTERL